MEPTQTSGTLSRHLSVSPLFFIGCGLVLIMGGVLVDQLEPGPELRRPAETALSTAEPRAVRSAPPPSLEQIREREAKMRAEQERLQAEAAAEKARQSAPTAEVVAEAQARGERDETARRNAAIDAARRSATEAEDAWKRFYRPSANCRDPASSASVECVNEYIKAKREFEASRPVTASKVGG